jgi:hypothetical protein
VSKPKSSEYKASEQEKALASVSLAEKNYFRQKYNPVLTELRDRASTENYEGVATGRAQADTMQALSARPSLAAARSVDSAADMASAAGAQALQGRAQGLTAQRADQVNVLKNARGMAADAQSGLSRAARIESTKQLEFARAKQARRNANFAAAKKIGVATINKIQDTGGFFPASSSDTPEDERPDPNKPIGSGYYGIGGL